MARSLSSRSGGLRLPERVWVVAMDVAMSDTGSDLPSAFCIGSANAHCPLEESCNAMHHVAAVLV